MIALSIALSLLGLLAFVAFMSWLGRRRAHDFLANRVQNAEGRFALYARLDEVGALRKSFEDATRITAESTHKALADLGQRVRACELKQGIPTQRKPGNDFVDEFLRTGGMPERPQG